MNIPLIIKSSVPEIHLKKKGDLATTTNDGQLETLSVGSDGAILTADSSQPTGFNWVTGAREWGSITGTLSNQTDLQNALNGKVSTTTNINGHALSNNVTLTASDVGLANVPNLDTSNPANITQDGTHRFVTDTEKAAWNSKLDANGSAANLTNFPTLNQNTTGTAAGLTAQYIDWNASSGGSSIKNKPTIPTALSQLSDDVTHRIVTDTEKTIWSGKQDFLGFTPVPDTRQVNGHALSADVTIGKSDVGLGNVTNDAQLKRGSGDINSLPLKPSPVAGDILLGEDSANGYAKIKIPISGLPAGDPGTTLSIDGGNASSVYGGLTIIDGGNA